MEASCRRDCKLLFLATAQVGGTGEGDSSGVSAALPQVLGTSEECYPGVRSLHGTGGDVTPHSRSKRRARKCVARCRRSITEPRAENRGAAQHPSAASTSAPSLRLSVTPSLRSPAAARSRLPLIAAREARDVGDRAAQGAHKIAHWAPTNHRHEPYAATATVTHKLRCGAAASATAFNGEKKRARRKRRGVAADRTASRLSP